MPPSTADHHRWLHRVALLLTAATFPLIFLGGLVTTYGAGMSVPDWPNSYGYNMFLFPVSQWVGGIFYEHTHRLKGTLVGFLAIILVFQAWGPARRPGVRRALGWLAAGCAIVALAWGGVVWGLLKQGAIAYETSKQLQHGFAGFASLALIFTAGWIARRREQRRWVRWLTVVALVAVCIQGTLGGLRVTEVNLTMAIIHGCFAQAFFCLAGFIAVATSRWWQAIVEQPDATLAAAGRTIAVPTMICLLAVFAQLVVGATMRHHGAGLAIPDLPLAYGKLLPPTDHVGLAEVNSFRAWTLNEKPVTLGQIWLHFGHRMGAIVVTGLIGWLVVKGLRAVPAGRLRTPLVLVGLLTLIQCTLGVLTVYFNKPAEVASAHVAVGALLLLTLAVLASRAYRAAAVVAPQMRPVAAPLAPAVAGATRIGDILGPTTR